VVPQTGYLLLNKNILEKKANPWQHFYCERSEPSSQLGTFRSPPLRPGFDNPLFDRAVVVVVEMEISGPSSSSTAVPSNIFVLNFGLPRSQSDADGDVDVEMAWRMQKYAMGAARSRRDIDICRAAG
jgi:hypothetical protein